MTPLREPAAAADVGAGVDVIVTGVLILLVESCKKPTHGHPPAAVMRLPFSCQVSGCLARHPHNPGVTLLAAAESGPPLEFAETVRELLTALATGAEPTVAAGGGLDRTLRQATPNGPREAIGVLADRWFRAVPTEEIESPDAPLLNRPDIGEAEKLHAVLREHVVAQRRWQELCSNESTFYRYRRAATAAFAERLWSTVADRPLPSNRPRPEYVRFVGRRDEVAALLRLLAEGSSSVVGVEGPGGSGKTALLHAVADTCEAAARDWRPLRIGEGEGVPVPVFDAVVWVALGALRQAQGERGGGDLASLLDSVARTLDYPGLLGRTLEDRRQAVRDLMARRSVLLIVDDADQASDRSLIGFLADLPRPSRALVSSRRRLPPEVRALMPEPLSPPELKELLLLEAERQGEPAIGRALAEGDATTALSAAARYPLLAGWAVGQLRRGQTVERVRERLARAEGDVFATMFSASVAVLSPEARALLATLPLLPAAADRPTLLSAGTGAALDQLLETSLLEVTGDFTDAERRYGLHAVTRSFVRTHLSLSSMEERATVLRLAKHLAERAERLGGPAHNWRSFGQLEAELPNVMALVEYAGGQARRLRGEPAGETFDATILKLAYGLRNVFWFGRAWSEGLTLFHRAIEAARRLEDRRAEGWNTYRLAALHYELGTAGYGEAAMRAREAALLLREACDPRGEGHALRLLGRATRARGSVGDAERLLGEAERLLAQHGHGDDRAIVRASHADLLRLSGRLDEAAALYDAVLRAGLDDPGTEANVRNDLGEIALTQGHLTRAEAAFAAAETLAEAAGARAILARCRLGQARVANARHDVSAVRWLAHSAADLFERLGDPERAYEARRLL